MIDITPKYRKLYEMSSSYIKDGKLIKYRWDNFDPKHIDSILNIKAMRQEEITSSMLGYLVRKGNLTIEIDGKAKLYNFDERFIELARKNDFPYGNFRY